MVQNVSLQTVCRKLDLLEDRLDRIEMKIVPEERLSARELKRVKKAKAEALAGETFSMKEVFG
ncbi:MAG: hypothetical protein JW744_02110 [Candidatus Diapherotrites archaeon]|uniref:Uncharacterized protein n=1 Tax=Candidatus Iainarchaeum sp. TaxID=3101447 RepID=A0A938YN51_9ARCH|nr:hypothetical protein [Candidatus Diapherotrites archaeon]